MSFMEKIRWPQVALLAVILAAAVTAIVLVPEQKWHVIPWGSIAAGIALVGSAIAGIFMKPMVDAAKPVETEARQTLAPRAGYRDTAVRPTRIPPPDREGGFVDVRLLYFVGAVALFVMGCAVLPGCGASALRSHATATVIATIAVSSAEDVYAAHLDAAQGECSDEACVDAAREAHRPAEAAIALTRVAVAAYRDAVEIANEADETGDLMAALVTAALRIVRHWSDVVAAMALLGEELPALQIGGAS